MKEKMSLSTEISWKNQIFVAVDLETTGAYPLSAEICEIGAVKWQNGKVIGDFQSLVKPEKPIPSEIIAIHNISNQMVAGAPSIEKVLPDFRNFLDGAYLVAHHAPFDMGFLAYEFENSGLSFPENPVFCSSLYSRKMIPECPNHKLQTLVNFLDLPKRQAHRALSDAQSCMDVLVKCFDRVTGASEVGDLLKVQPKQLVWRNFSIQEIQGKENIKPLIEGIQQAKPVRIIYKGGSSPGRSRVVEPIGIVRSPDGDFLAAREQGFEKVKRYYLSRIDQSELSL